MAEKTTVQKVQDFEEGLEKEVKDWKSKLTAGLDNTQVFISLAFLGCFYTAYALTNYSLGNTRDLDSITSGCHCRHKARTLYRLWFYLFSSLWALVHTYIYVERSLKSLELCNLKPRTCGKLIEAILSYIISNCKDLCCYIICRFRSGCSCCPAYNPPNQGSGEIRLSDRDKLNIKHYERILWYRYYKLYVAGYSKDIEPEPNTDTKTESTPAASSPTREGTSDDYVCCCRQSGCMIHFKNCYRRVFLNILVRFILVLLKYIAQGATVPILMLQVFDTYAFLCFSPNVNYCRTASEYEIHLAQAAITMSFYFSIAVAQLASTLLQWDSAWKRRSVTQEPRQNSANPIVN